jgi:hypothetical protein
MKLHHTAQRVVLEREGQFVTLADDWDTLITIAPIGTLQNIVA